MDEFCFFKMSNNECFDGVDYEANNKQDNEIQPPFILTLGVSESKNNR
jgi:hypothetical protein